MTPIDHIAGTTRHARKGAIRNGFTYSVDYVLLDMERAQPAPRLFSRNRRNLTALWDRDHGGAPDEGRGAPWVREVLAAQGLPEPTCIELLAQPRVLGHVFNPVSFWLCHDAAGLRVVIAEVSNTFGQRHSYLCHREDRAPITREDVLTAHKIFHVSPFQPVAGDYRFRFDITPARVDIRIDFTTAEGGLYATLSGARAPLTNRAILGACLRRPFGSRRVLTLIFWQALKLRLKGARYNRLPAPPKSEISK